MVKINALLSIVKTQFKCYIQYSINTFFSIFVSIIQVIISCSIWQAVYSEKEIINGITQTEVLPYMIISTIIMGRITYGVNRYLSRLIETGDLAQELLKPMDFQIYYFSRRLGDFVASFVIEGIPALIIASYLLQINMLPNLVNFIAFMISIFLALFISFVFEFAMGTLSFYTKNGLGIQGIKLAIITFFSGALFPIEFLPKGLQQIINVLPFKGIVNIPANIYIGRYTLEQNLGLIWTQALWVCILFVLSRIVMKMMLHKVEIQGG